MYRFAGFTFDPERRALLRPEGRIFPLTGKAGELLLVLLESPGVTLSREQLLERIWPGVATTDGSLRRAVHLLRQALEGGDEVVETVRGRGYRLRARVEWIAPTAPSPPAAPFPESIERAPRRPSLGTGLALGASAALVLIVAFLARPIPIPLPDSRPDPAPVARPPSSIAVLRFTDRTSDGVSDHRVDGLSERIIHRLAEVPGLHVIARTSSFAVPREASISDLGTLLGVGTVLEGEVFGSVENRQVTARLVRVHDETPLFSANFELGSGDGFEATDRLVVELSDTIADAVAVLRPLRQSGDRSPIEARAYDHFLRGATSQHYRDLQSATETVAHFERAVALDPEFADAWAELSRARARFAFHVRHDNDRYDELLRRADDAAQRALDLDSSSGLAHAAHAGTLRRRGDLRGAAEGLRRAIELCPGYAALLEDYGVTLARLGRLEEGRDQLMLLVERDPLSPLAHRQLGRIHLYLHEPELAMRSLRRCLELNPTDEDGHRLLADAYRAQGAELQAGEIFVRGYPWGLRGLARAGLRVLGMRRMARISYELIRWQTGQDCLRIPYEAAGYLAAARDREGVFRCLAEAPSTTLTFIGLEPVFEPFRDDPRFVRILASLGRPAPVVPLHASPAR